MIWILTLFFITLFVGMTPMEVSAGLLSLSALYCVWQKRSNEGHWPLFATSIEWLLLLWLPVVGLGFAVNGIFDQTFLLKALEFKWILFLYLLLLVVVRSRLTEEILPWASVPAIAAGLYAVVIAFLGYDPIKAEPLELSFSEGLARTGGLFSDSMTMAHVYGLIFCWFFGCLLTFGRYRDRKAIWLLLASLSLGLAVLLSFTRGMWLAVAVAIFVMSMMFSLRLGILVLSLGSLLFVSLFEFWPSFHERISMSLSNKVGYDSERFWIWKANWEIFKDHPFFGVGYGENRTLLPEYFKRLGAPEGTLVSHAHNQYLHFLSGTGVVGLMIYLLVVGIFLRISVQTWSRISDRYPFHRGLCLGLIGAQIAFFIGGLTEANFERAKVKYAIVMTWALALWLAYEYRVLKSRLY